MGAALTPRGAALGPRAVPAVALGLVTAFWFTRWREGSTGFERFVAVPTTVAASTVLILMVSGAVRAG